MAKLTAEKKDYTEENTIEEAKEDIAFVLSIHPDLKDLQLCITNDPGGVNNFCKWVKDNDFWNDHDFQQLAELEAFRGEDDFNDLNEFQAESRTLLKEKVIKKIKVLIPLFLEEQQTIEQERLILKREIYGICPEAEQ